jgi:hypothetical protein
VLALAVVAAAADDEGSGPNWHVVSVAALLPDAVCTPKRGRLRLFLLLALRCCCFFFFFFGAVETATAAVLWSALSFFPLNPKDGRSAVRRCVDCRIRLIYDYI